MIRLQGSTESIWSPPESSLLLVKAKFIPYEISCQAVTVFCNDNNFIAFIHAFNSIEIHNHVSFRRFSHAC